MKQILLPTYSIVAALLLAGCTRTVTVDADAAYWEVAILNGQCESALQYRLPGSSVPADARFKVVRTLHCPVYREGAREFVELLQVKNAAGRLFWFAEEHINRS